MKNEADMANLLAATWILNAVQDPEYGDIAELVSDQLADDNVIPESVVDLIIEQTLSRIKSATIDIQWGDE
jgi:hypothetical protein